MLRSPHPTFAWMEGGPPTPLPTSAAAVTSTAEEVGAIFEFAAALEQEPAGKPE